MDQKKTQEDKLPKRAINLKLVPTEEQAKILNEYIDFYSMLHRTAVEKYLNSGNLKPLNIKGAKSDYITQAQKKEFREELVKLGCSGTFNDLAIGQRGATSYYKGMLKKAGKEFKFQDTKIKELEQKNPSLLNPKSVSFNDVNEVTGTCVMCGKTGTMPYQSNEPELHDECMCDVCHLEFIKLRKELKVLKRRIPTYYFLYRKIAEQKKVSTSLQRLIDIFDTTRPLRKIRSTVSDMAEMKNYTVKVDFGKKTVSMKTYSGEYFTVGFSGESYYQNFPRYGYMSDENKFRKLILDFLEKGGYTNIFRRRVKGNTEFFLSIATNYPAPLRKLPVRGYVIVTNRSVFIYIGGQMEFIKLNRVYLKKKVYEAKRKKIQKHNDELLLFEWGQIPKWNNKLIRGLRSKLGFVWKGKHDVKKSDDGHTISICAEDLDVEISLDTNGKFAVLTSKDGENVVFPAIETKSRDGKYHKFGIYLENPVPLPRKYSEGNLKKYIRHQNQVTARLVVEKVKEKLWQIGEDASIALLDYTFMHTEGNTITPIVSLNEQIKNMLQYDGIYGGSIYWGRLKKLKCPRCGKEFEQREERLVIRDIILSKINSWICECDHNINSSLIAVARNIDRNLEELMKPLPKKEMKDDENLEQQ